MSCPKQLPRLGVEIGATIRLAAPLAAAQLAQIGMGATDTVLLGSLGRDALAAGGLGANLFFTLVIVVAGALTSVGILVSHARGSGRPQEIALAMRGGFLFSVLAAIPPMLLLWWAEPILLAMGQPPSLAHAIARYDQVLLFAMPAALLIATQRAFLVAMDRAWLMTATAIIAVVANGVLNYGLIHGAWGLPRLGYMGSCTATLITIWCMAAAIGLGMRGMKDLRAFRLLGRIDWSVMRELASLGWPIAVTMGMEIFLFSAAAIVIGRFGATSLAAHQISITIASTTFMVPLALSQAANVRVGLHMGGGSPVEARRAGFVAFALGVGFMSLMAIAMLAFPEAIARLYIASGNPAGSEVIALAVRLLTIAAFYQVFDGAQTIAAGALRGLKDTRAPALAAAIGYWGVGFVTGWYLGVKLGLGAVGVWWGLAAGLASVAILLSLRYWRLSGRLVRP